jgi:hypothetical protein
LETMTRLKLAKCCTHGVTGPCRLRNFSFVIAAVITSRRTGRDRDERCFAALLQLLLLLLRLLGSTVPIVVHVPDGLARRT